MPLLVPSNPSESVSPFALVFTTSSPTYGQLGSEEAKILSHTRRSAGPPTQIGIQTSTQQRWRSKNIVKHRLVGYTQVPSPYTAKLTAHHVKLDTVRFVKFVRRPQNIWFSGQEFSSPGPCTEKCVHIESPILTPDFKIH